MNDIADSDPQALFDYVAKQLAGKVTYLHVIEGDTSGKRVPDFDYKKTYFAGRSSPTITLISRAR